MEVNWEMDISGGTQWSHDGHLQYISMMTWRNYEMDHLYCQIFFLAFSCLVAKAQKGDSDIYHHSKNKKQKRDIILHKIYIYAILKWFCSNISCQISCTKCTWGIDWHQNMFYTPGLVTVIFWQIKNQIHIS